MVAPGSGVGQRFLTFAIGVLLARQLGLAAFGSYVIAQTYMQYAGGVQGALVVIPMMSAVPLERDPVARHTMLRGFFAVCDRGAAVDICRRHVSRMVGGPVGVACTCSRARDRGLAFVRGYGRSLRPGLAAARPLRACTANRAVFLSDLVAYGGQWCVLVFLAWRGALTLGGALWVLAGSFGLSAVATVAAVRVSPDFRAVPTVIRTHGRSGRDYLLSGQLQWLGTSGVIMVGTGFIGTQAAGAIRASQNLLGPFNVLFQWMENVIPGRAALRLREGGRDQLALYLNRLGWIGFLAIGLFAVLLPPIDGWLMETIYGAAYRPFAVLVVLQALYFLFGHLYRMQTYYSRSLGRAGDVARSSAWWAVVAVSYLPALTVNVLAERGIMIAMLAGEVAAILYLVWLRYGLRDPPPAGTEERYLQWQGAGRMRLRPAHGKQPCAQGSAEYVFPDQVDREDVPASPGRRVAGIGPQRFRPALTRATQLVCPPAAPGPNGARRPQRMGGLPPGNGRAASQNDSSIDGRIRAVLLAYARVAHDAADVQIVRNEALVLAAVAATDVSTQAPRLIDHGPLTEPEGHFLLESAGAEQAASVALDDRHFRFLHGLMRNGATRTWRALLEQMADELELVCESTRRHGGRSPTCSNSHCQPCRNVSNMATLPRGTSVNRRRTSCSCSTWDRADLHGVPWLDALHYCFQVETLVRRRPAATVIRSMKAVFVEPSAQCYAEAVPPTADVASPLIFLYLLRTLSRDLRDQPWKTFDEMVRIQVLQQLLREEN